MKPPARRGEGVLARLSWLRVRPGLRSGRLRARVDARESAAAAAFAAQFRIYMAAAFSNAWISPTILPQAGA
eukprot:961849-Pyramimonas_sp.AAC.1